MAFCSLVPPLLPAAGRSEWEANANLSVSLMSCAHTERMDKRNSQAGKSRLSLCPSHLHTPVPARELELQALTPGDAGLSSCLPPALGWSTEWAESQEILCSAGPVSACVSREAQLDESLRVRSWGCLSGTGALGRKQSCLWVTYSSEEPENFPNSWPQRDRRGGPSDFDFPPFPFTHASPLGVTE